MKLPFNSLLNDVLEYAQKTGSELGSKVREGDVGSLKKVSGIAGTAGVLGALLGKKVSGSSTFLKLGSAAALGALAYQAYQKYNSNQSPAQSDFNTDGEFSEQHSKTILRAMIAAAACDGQIDEQERQLIVGENSLDAGLGAWLEKELNNPSEVSDISKEIGNNQALAAEAYLAARMVCGELSRKEIVFLAQFSQALKLDDKLVEQLEKQAGF